MTRPRTLLIDGRPAGWAIAEDYRLARAALEDVVEFTSRSRAEAIHAVWWRLLLSLSPRHLRGKRIICQMSGEPWRQFEDLDFALVAELVGCWVVRSDQAARQLTALGLASVQIPYLVDLDVFRPLDANACAAAREHFGLPSTAYLVGSFQRDSEGRDRHLPKLVKGPDVFAQVLASARRRGVDVVAVLAGPRRHYLRQRLRQMEVPYIFVGTETDHDDYPGNVLDRTELNRLYNLLDLYLVSSRSEGGPHAILEASAAGCPLLSTAVGVAPDLLAPECVWRTTEEAVEAIVRDHAERWLDQHRDRNRKRVLADCRPAVAKAGFERLYADLGTVPVAAPPNGLKPVTHPTRVARVIARLLPRHAPAPVRVGLVSDSRALWERLATPWAAAGVELAEPPDVWLVDGLPGSPDKWFTRLANQPAPVLHRLPPGPWSDDLLNFNAQAAVLTVVDRLEALAQLYRVRGSATRAVVVPEPGPLVRAEPAPSLEGRVVATPAGRQCADAYLAGEVLVDLEPGAEWTASLAGADALLVGAPDGADADAVRGALAVGVPVCYPAAQGYDNLVQHGGLAFTVPAEVAARVASLRAGAEVHRQLITLPSAADCATAYARVFRRLQGAVG